MFSVLPLLTVVLLAASPSVDGKAAPTDWRLPTESELVASPSWRGDSASQYLSAAADFDGDGTIDVAELVVSDSSDECAVRIRLSRDGSRTRIVGRMGRKDLAAIMGVAITPPGDHPTACGKGYVACAQGEPASLALTLPAVEYFRWGSASSVFVWHAAMRDFRQHWLSD